jgi:hypothetical protein
VGTDDTLRPISESLVPTVTRLFDLDAMPAAQIRQTSFFRCFEYHVLVCTVGANLPCQKADTRRHLTGAQAWCAEHLDSDLIPEFATGHATVYRWRCIGATAAIIGTQNKVDRRGFVAQYWKRADRKP